MHLLVQIENILPVNSEVPEEVKISYNNNEIYYQIVSVEWQCGDEIICDYENDDEEMNKLDSHKFALNLLKKVKRHNSKDKSTEIAKKFNEKVKKMDSKYKEYCKEPTKYKGIRQFYKNLSE